MEKKDLNPLLALGAGVLAWLVPGAGHVLLGRRLRGVVIFLGVHLMFWSGVAMGGVFTVEPLRQPYWWWAQACTGTSGLVSWYRQSSARSGIAADLHLEHPFPPPADPSGNDKENPNWWRTYTVELARRNLALVHPTDSVAYAYTGIAGMLNLLCIFDVIMLVLMGQLSEPTLPAAATGPPRQGAA